MTDRSKYIGGSAISAIINASPHQTALELWERMVYGTELPVSAERARFFRRRQQMEPVIVRMLAEDHGIQATKVSFHDPNRYSDTDVPHFAAEIDFETVMTPDLAERFPRLSNVETGVTINGEIKTWNEWGRKGWGDVEQEEIPNHVAAQVLWGLGVTRRPAALVCPLFGLDELRVYPVLHDAGVIGWLRSEASSFWALVQERRMPAPKADDLADVKRAAMRLLGMPVDLDDATAEILADVFNRRAEIRELEKFLSSQEYKVFHYICQQWNVPIDPSVKMPHDNAVLRLRGHPLAVWRRQTREGVDVKRLKEEDPMSYHRFRRDSVFGVLAKPPKGTK